MLNEMKRKQIKLRSREIRDTHMEIHCHTTCMEDGEKIKKEFKKAVHKMNRLLDCKVSYELTITMG